jgi:drug/metabolite transporter (DMT)-like permease
MPATQLQTKEKPLAILKRRTQSTRLRAYVALAVGILCIGFSAIFTKWADLPGSVSAFYRVLIATAALTIPYLLYVYRRRQREKLLGIEERAPRMGWALFGVTVLAGLFFALDLVFWNTALLVTSAANATLLGNLSTVWVSLGALVLLHESLKRRFWLGMVIAVAGTAIIVGRDVFAHPDLGWGDLLSVGSSLFYAGYLLSTNRARRRMGTMPFMWISSVAATVILLGFVLVMGEQLTGLSADQWWSLILLGLVSHALGWMAINYSLGHLPASLASVTLLSQPVITALLAVPLLAEALSAYQIVGGGLVLAGIYIVNRR